MSSLFQDMRHGVETVCFVGLLPDPCADPEAELNGARL